MLKLVKIFFYPSRVGIMVSWSSICEWIYICLNNIETHLCCFILQMNIEIPALVVLALSRVPNQQRVGIVTSKKCMWLHLLCVTRMDNIDLMLLLIVIIQVTELWQQLEDRGQHPEWRVHTARWNTTKNYGRLYRIIQKYNAEEARARRHEW